MTRGDENLWARSRASSELIAWAMDLSEEERAELIDSMPSSSWTRDDQARYAAILVVIADREELGLPNGGLAFLPGRPLAGLPPESAPEMTFPQLLATPFEEIVDELTELTDRVAGMGGLSDLELQRLGILWTALTILKDPENYPPAP